MKSCGTAVLILNATRFTLVQTETDLAGQRITVDSVYTPNYNQTLFLREVFSKLNLFRKGDLLIGGDLKYVGNLHMDKSATKNLRGPADTDLVDLL